MDESKYLVFKDHGGESWGRKTKMVQIHSARTDGHLGTIRWHGPWRRYCFFPDPDTLWSAGCMKAVEDYISRLMAERGRP